MIVIIIPYRAGKGQHQRASQKEILLPRLHDIAPDALVIVAEQTMGKKFNRGALLNAAAKFVLESGYVQPVRKGHRFILHDVDLLPMHDLAYAYCEMPSHCPVFHIASVWKRYDSDTYLGGVLSIQQDALIKVNGFPNMFEGWGGEDDEFRRRLLWHHIPVERAVKGTLKDLENLTLEEKLKHLRNSGEKCTNKWEVRDHYNSVRREHVEGYAENHCQTDVIHVSQKHIHIRIHI